MQEPTYQRIKLTIAYEGAAFCGWQIQPGLRTVQDEIEKAISLIVDSPVRIHGAGRTDSGVHAVGQVAHFDVPRNKAMIPWQKSLNSLLPDDISILESCLVAPGFHSQYSSTKKTYSYRLWLDKTYLSPFRRHYVWRVGRLNMEALDEGLKIFTGTHDFASFQNMGTPVSSTERTILSFTYKQEQDIPEYVFKVTGTGFLKQMVRNIMGCLVAVGREKIPPSRITDLFELCDRTEAPPTAPARGLCLEKVYFD